LNESATSDPTTHYGVFKRTNEGNARVYFANHGLSSVGLRPLTVYGVKPRHGTHKRSHESDEGGCTRVPFQIRFSGATDFQYVKDTAAAFIACADRAPAERTF
jgi:nucleoside-diphosphate-sugar epimerase